LVKNWLKDFGPLDGFSSFFGVTISTLGVFFLRGVHLNGSAKLLNINTKTVKPNKRYLFIISIFILSKVYFRRSNESFFIKKNIA
jgi:hypothetical protein